jgi:hypothetical protein
MDPESPDLELVIGGRPVRFPAVWLRDNCPCPDCLVPGTGQKVNDITDIPNGLAITHTEDAGESVLVTFAPDRHRSAFPRSWLEEHALDDERDGDGRTRVLHARTAFSMSPGSAERHLQGCYADLDGLASTLAVLKREESR